MDITSQQKHLQTLNRLLVSLRAGGFIQCPDDLKQEQTWHNWAACQEKTQGSTDLLASYVSHTSNYFPRYFLHLNTQDRLRMRRYALPLLPFGSIQRYFPSNQLRSSQQPDRKAQTDILVHLYPLLR